MKNEDIEQVDTEQTETICDVCGSIKVLENDEYICPHCDGEIDFFGDEDESIPQ